MAIPDFSLDIKKEPELFDKKSEEIARNFVKLERNKKGKLQATGVSKNQLRKLYDEVKNLHKKLEDTKNWNSIYPLIKMVKAKTAYLVARAKKTKSVRANYEALYEFMKGGIDKIKTKEDFDTFVLLFEAIYGYYYELGGYDTK